MSADNLFNAVVDARVHVLSRALDTVLNMIAPEKSTVQQVFIDEHRTRPFLNQARQLRNNPELVDKIFNQINRVMEKQYADWTAACDDELLRIKREGFDRIIQQADVLKQFNSMYRLDYEDMDIIHHYVQMDLILKKTMGKLLRYVMRGARLIIVPLLPFNEIYSDYISHICSSFDKLCKSSSKLLATECAASVEEYYVHEIAYHKLFSNCSPFGKTGYRNGRSYSYRCGPREGYRCYKIRCR